jgi:MFS family permease
MRVLWAASVLGGLGQSMAGTAGSLLAREVSDADAAAGLPQAALVAGAAVSAVGLSRLTGRRGRSVALSAGGLVAVLGCLTVVGAAAVGSLLLVLVGSLLLGAGNTAVMLGRYAAADLGAESERTWRMASVLTAITIGAVAGPNLLAPAEKVTAALGLPVFAGTYLLAATAFTAAAATLAVGLPSRLGPRTPEPTPTPGQGLGSYNVDRPETGSTRAGLGVLSIANLVMVVVMTMAPIQMHHHGSGLGLIGLVVSLHIAAMFAPSPLSAWLVDHVGAARTAAMAGVTLMTAGVLAAGAGSTLVLLTALVLLGLGWNLALISGSSLLTAGVRAADRPGREGWGEIGMGVAAAGGGAASGPVMAGGGYGLLAIAATAIAALVLPLARHATKASRSP